MADTILKIDQRALRAKNFASQIMQTLSDFLPRDGVTGDRIYQHLAGMAYESNAMIINLPPEYDHLTGLAAERAMIEKMLEPITVKMDEI